MRRAKEQGGNCLGRSQSDTGATFHLGNVQDSKWVQGEGIGMGLRVVGQGMGRVKRIHVGRLFVRLGGTDRLP